MTDPKGINTAPLERALARLLNPFEQFIHHQSSSGLLLMLATILALILANSAFSAFYLGLKDIPVSVGFGTWSLNKPLILWVNDLLMAFFFFVVGLELERELYFGELATPRKAALPIVAAIGGMVVPAGIFWLFNHGTPAISGWATPMATDIAFAIGVLMLLGSRVPRALMAMLVAIAIIDDLGAVLVIAIFYSHNLQPHYLAYAAVVVAMMFALNRAGVRKAVPYFFLVMGLWYALLKAGVHPTLAGVIGAFMVPATPRYNPDYFTAKARELLGKFEQSRQNNPILVKNTELRGIAEALEHAVHNVTTPSQRLEHIWHLPVAFIIVPLFAFFNAGISLAPQDMLAALSHQVFHGVFFGLLIGKFIGIFGFSWLAVRVGWLSLPDGLRLGHVAGMALVAGIGFTMSIFISSLAFNGDEQLLNTAKAGIFAASLISGGLGAAWLYKIGLKSKG
jgi:Na+:H+ antiporter, NhaA family